MKLVLRGHHLLCLKGFQGYGYDDAFVENMKDVNSKRKLNETTVFLTNAPDDICRACPKLKEGVCENELHNNAVIRMDNEVLKKFDAENEYESIELFDMVDEQFNSKESVSKICSNCMWHEKCLFYQNLLNNR